MSASFASATQQFAKKSNQKRRKNNPNELFVGNLSYFCEEQNLYDLFSNTIALRDAAQGQDPLLLMNYVSAVRIIYSEGQPQRSLMFGFVTLNNLNDAQYAVEQLQSKMFMGRKLKVQFSNTRNNNKGSEDDMERVGFQVHVAFQSHFSGHEIKRPTEEFLRNIFTPFGEELLDIAVKEYTLTEAPQRQEGYAFATFASEQIAETVIQQYSGFSKDGITLDCTWSHRSNHLKKAEYFFQMRAASLGLAVPPSGGSPPAGSGTASLQGNSSNNSIASMNDRTGGLVEALALESLRLSNSPARSISPLDQMSMHSLPVRSLSQAPALPDALRPSALDMNMRLDGLSAPSPSPSAVLTRGSLPTTGFSSHSNSASTFSGLYSGSYSNSVTPTAATSGSLSSRDSAPRHSAQRSLPVESYSASSSFSDMSNLATVGSYRGPGTYASGDSGINAGPYGNPVPRSPMYAQQQQRYTSHVGMMPQPQGYSQQSQGMYQQGNRYPNYSQQKQSHAQQYAQHDMYSSAQNYPHSPYSHQAPGQYGNPGMGNNAGNGYAVHPQMHPRGQPQMHNSLPNRQYERGNVDDIKMNNTVFNSLPIQQHYSRHDDVRNQPNGSLSSMAVHGGLSDQPVRSLNTFPTVYSGGVSGQQSDSFPVSSLGSFNTNPNMANYHFDDDSRQQLSDMLRMRKM